MAVGADQLPPSGNWILALDADQRITPELRDEIGALLEKNPRELDGIDGVYIKRRQVSEEGGFGTAGIIPSTSSSCFARTGGL